MVKKANGPKLFKVTCKDMGLKDCGFSVTTHSPDEAKKAIFAHARYAHPEKLSMMSESQKQGMMKKLDEMIRKQM
jgi:predicted small metal-binding protein